MDNNKPYDPEVDVPNYIKQFVIAVRRRALQDEGFVETTDKSRTKLIIEISSKLEDKTDRIPVLQAITGIPLTSQNQLTQAYTSVLIDEVINVNSENQNAIAFIERLVKKRTSLKPWQLFPWDGPKEISLPTLPEDDPF